MWVAGLPGFEPGTSSVSRKHSNRAVQHFPRRALERTLLQKIVRNVTGHIAGLAAIWDKHRPTLSYSPSIPSEVEAYIILDFVSTRALSAN